MQMVHHVRFVRRPLDFFRQVGFERGEVFTRHIGKEWSVRCDRDEFASGRSAEGAGQYGGLAADLVVSGAYA